MIDITHRQAQRLMRSHLDERLPNEQWFMLQAHLETCSTCREYQGRLAGLEKNLKRTLHAGWDGALGPQDGIEQQVTRTFQQVRPRQRRVMVAAGAAIFILVLIALLGGPAGIRDRIQAASSRQAAGDGIPETGPAALALTPTATRLPTVAPGQFGDVVAYQGRSGSNPSSGDGEIFLLNPGAPAENLTNNPANDTNPAWAPDGEWLAFLSDRADKTEVFVTNITGGKVIQLTSEPSITWHGPLSWSADGKWIALSGTRDQQGGQGWIYLVALDGSGVLSLAGSRGGDTPIFSPTGDRIAYYRSDGSDEGIIIHNLSTGETASVKSTRTPASTPQATSPAFGWSPDGEGLAYISATPEPGAQVLAVQEIGQPPSQFTEANHAIQVDGASTADAFRGIAWAPNGMLVYLEDLRLGAQQSACWTLQASFAGLRRPSTRSFSYDGLCVEGSLSQASWTADRQWIVVQARQPWEDALSIYALRMPGGSPRERGFRTSTPAPGESTRNAPVDNGPGTILRLTDEASPGAMVLPRPRLEPSAKAASLDPQPVTKARADLPPSDLSTAKRPGQLSYVVKNQSTSQVISANPDGTEERVLLATTDLARCPAWSPDGKSIALVQVSRSEPPEHSGAGENPLEAALPPGPQLGGPGQGAPGASGVENIFVLDPSSNNLRQVSRLNSIPPYALEPEQVTYGCPVWSPASSSGSRSLAALVSNGQRTYLAVLPTAVPGATEDLPKPRPRYLPLISPDWSIPPVWALDGESIYLLQSGASQASPGMTVVKVPSDPLAPLVATAGPPAWQSQFTPWLAILPNGKDMVQLEINDQAGSAHLHHIILSNDGETKEGGPAVYLTRGQNAEGKLYARIRSGSLTWLRGGTFGIILHAGPAAAIKTQFYLYNMILDEARLVAEFEDTVSGAAWSPDGRWLVFSAESGLWGVDVPAAAEGRAGPVWLAPEPVQDLVWK